MRTAYKTWAAVAACPMMLAACGNSSDTAPDAAGGQALVVATDLPLQGPIGPASESTNNMIQLYLEEQGDRAGDHTIELKMYDEAASSDGSWDAATCARNAQDHVSNANEIAVMGPLGAGCAKVTVPVLNQDPSGPMLVVSHATTNPGLTKSWDPGEPEIYYPTGERNYARVVTTDDRQGAAAAQFIAQELKAERCFVLHDDQTYGRGIAKAFTEEAPKEKVKIVGTEEWDPAARNYKKLFQQVEITDPDCLYIAGNYESNGEQLLQDKVKVLGDNETVPTMVAAGFSGIPDFQSQEQADGVYLTFPGLDKESLIASSPSAAALARAYEERFGEEPVSSHAFYGVAAMQVIMAAIAQSDGTRKSVTDATFGGDGITIPAADSVLGRKIAIDPETGDVKAKEITVLRMVDGQESVVQTWPVD